MTTRIALSGLLTILTPSVALAHVGHVGELAGHTHWVGVAALAGSALIAGIAAWAGRKSDEADTEEAPAEPSHGETTEATT